MRVRRVRFKLDAIRRGRLHSITFAAPISLLATNTNSFLTATAVRTIRQKLMASSNIGQLFSRHWLNPVLKYVVSGRRQDARQFIAKQAHGRKLSLFLRNRRIVVRRQLRRKRISLSKQYKKQLRTRQSWQYRKFQTLVRPALQTYRRKHKYS